MLGNYSKNNEKKTMEKTKKTKKTKRNLRVFFIINTI